MYQSIAGRLVELRDRLGPSPLTPVFRGLDHIRYHVPPGEGRALVSEISRRTGYRLSGCFRHRTGGGMLFEMQLAGFRPDLVIEEVTIPMAGFPRFAAMGFRVVDLETVSRLLTTMGIAFREQGAGLATEPLPGLGDCFYYLPESAAAWHEGDALEVLPCEAGSAPFTDVRAQIGCLDHIAYRIRLQEVEAAAEMIMKLTAYRFDSCYTVTDQKAETMVFRYGDAKPAIVASYGWNEESVVHNYVKKYGPRVHHTAYYTGELRGVLTRQKQEGIEFTTADLIGDETRGILQVFSTPSAHSHEITEYVQRFGSFIGFFDRGNVGDLMRSTVRFNQ
jgi:4-hydroxyphenylpyruvate dioxygenase-like putative hemolysin